jgi:hypothetical protein
VNRRWLAEPVTMPRGIALALIATTVFTVVGWTSAAVLWLALHL